MKLNKEDEVNRIHRKFMVFYTYLTNKYSTISFYDQMKEVIDDAVAKKNLRGLRAVDKDLSGWLKEMETDDVAQIQILLQQELGEEAFVVEKASLQALNRIVKRGVIKSKAEYEILSQRAEEINGDDSKKDELNTLNLLLVAFHKSMDGRK
jgi:CRISPR/Cas system CSM-associated protein Csm2 small subunit